MPNQIISVGRNPNADFPAWMCEHVATKEPKHEGQLIVCESCLDAWDAGAPVVDKNTRKILLADDSGRWVLTADYKVK
jgi:hypothetical protein